ncbi:integral membrane protein [Streptomyces zinciresistens K42]|uniref:Integral membrane protein n=2 Tax=Streptomyces TaxID=1883 RepID=G2GD23_9ACTN|nr:integral membrane protein [Streptomyces zinciresistens K42]
MDYEAVDGPSPYTQQLDMQNLWQVPDPVMSPEGWDLDEELAQMLGTPRTPEPVAHRREPERPAPRPVHRRRPQPGAHSLTRNPRFLTVSFLVTLITLCAVTMLTWSISYSYDQLRTIALLVVSPDLAHWWPLTVYGPWMLAGLSILRASVQRRTARRSWAVMLISSGTAVALCIGQSADSLLAMVVVGIPPITALVCFRELIGQFSTRPGPRHAADAVNGSKQPKT